MKRYRVILTSQFYLTLTSIAEFILRESASSDVAKRFTESMVDYAMNTFVVAPERGEDFQTTHFVFRKVPHHQNKRYSFYIQINEERATVKVIAILPNAMSKQSIIRKLQ